MGELVGVPDADGDNGVCIDFVVVVVVVVVMVPATVVWVVTPAFADESLVVDAAGIPGVGVGEVVTRFVLVVALDVATGTGVGAHV